MSGGDDGREWRQPGETLGRYRLLEVLGRGGMGEVFLAEDPQIGRRVAVKIVRPGAGRPREAAERTARLRREARAAGKLLHPNIVTLFDVGEEDGLVYLAFEYVEGRDLEQLLVSGGPVPLPRCLDVVRQVAQGLSYAHEHGVIHRDVKPGNILLAAGGGVKIADFGIARIADQGTQLTTSGAVVGSPQYLAPEQVRGVELDGRCDLFSLGVVFYELVTGRRPFKGDTLTSLVYQILHREPAPAAELRRELPPPMAVLLERMLAKDPKDRPATAAEVVREVEAVEAAALGRIPPTLAPGPPSTAGSGPAAERSLPRTDPESSASEAMGTAPTQVLISVPPAGGDHHAEGPQSARGAPARPWLLLAASVAVVALLAWAGLRLIEKSGSPTSAPLPPPAEPATIAAQSDEDPGILARVPEMGSAGSSEGAGSLESPGPRDSVVTEPSSGPTPGPSTSLPPPATSQAEASPEELLDRPQENRPEGRPEGAPGSAATYQVRRGVALTVWPTHARVLVDGKKPSSAVKLFERRDRRPRGVLRLEPGVHRITVLAQGFNPQEIEVVVREDAPVDLQPVAVRLTRRQLRPRNP